MSVEISPEIEWDSFFDSVDVEIDVVIDGTKEIKTKEVTISAELMEGCHDAAYEKASSEERYRVHHVDSGIDDDGMDTYNTELARRVSDTGRALSAGQLVIRQVSVRWPSSSSIAI